MTDSSPLPEQAGPSGFGQEAETERYHAWADVPFETQSTVWLARPDITPIVASSSAGGTQLMQEIWGSREESLNSEIPTSFLADGMNSGHGLEEAGLSGIWREDDAGARHAMLDAFFSAAEDPATNRRLTAEKLRLAQRWVGRGPGQMTTRQFSEGIGISGEQLRRNILADGTLTVQGEQLLAGRVRGGSLRAITADIVRSARVAISGGQGRNAFALEHRVSADALSAFILIDGSLTLKGVQTLAGGVRGGQVRGIDADLLRDAQTAILSGQRLRAFSAERNVSLAALRNYVRSDGTLTAPGEQMLAGRVSRTTVERDVERASGY
jgi:hypothetical protein